MNRFSVCRGATPLFVACQNGYLECVIELIENKANYNRIREVDKATPLMIASYNGHESVVKYLLSCKNINILHRNKDNLNAFTCAATSLHKDICDHLYTYVMNEYLYQSDAKEVVNFINQGDNDDCLTPLMRACLPQDQEKGIKIVKWLVDTCKVKLDPKCREGKTALEWATIMRTTMLQSGWHRKNLNLMLNLDENCTKKVIFKSV